MGLSTGAVNQPTKTKGKTMNLQEQLDDCRRTFEATAMRMRGELTELRSDLTAAEDQVKTAKQIITDTRAERDELKKALQAIVKITDGSQPKDYPGVLMVARTALARCEKVGDK